MSVSPWQADKRRADALMPEVKRILGEHLITVPADVEDMEHNTDLIVLGLGGGIRVAVRIRDERYAMNFGNEFTIRASRPNGTKTELSKIVEGWGNYFFYGFADESWSRLIAWTLGDLSVFRLWFNRSIYRMPEGQLPGAAQTNGDGSSGFRAFQIDDLPGEFVVARRVYQRPAGVSKYALRAATLPRR